MKNLRYHLAIWCVIAFSVFVTVTIVDRTRKRARSLALFALMQSSVCPDACPRARQLVAEGIDPNVRDDEGETLIMRAVRNEDVGMVKVIEKAGGYTDGASELFVAALLGRPVVAQRLLRANISPNVKDHTGSTPLFYAAIAGDVPITQLLLKHGAAINLVDRNGLTALDCTVEYVGVGNRATARLLKSVGGKHGEELWRMAREKGGATR